MTSTSSPGAAISLTDWSFLPAGTLPTSNYYFSTWIVAQTGTTGAEFLQILTETGPIKITWTGGTATVLLNGASILTITRTYADNQWFFLTMNLNNNFFYCEILLRNGGFGQGNSISSVSYPLGTGASVMAPSGGTMVVRPM